MKYKIDKKYKYWGITLFLVICACIFFYYMLFHGVKIQSAIHKISRTLMPIFFGFGIAYILTPVLNLIENKILIPLSKKRKNQPKNAQKSKKRIRALAILLNEIFMLLIIYGLFAMLIPQLTKSIQSIVFQSSTYLKNITNWINNIAVKYPDIQNFLNSNHLQFDTESIVNWINDNVDVEKYLSNFGNYFSLFYNSVYGIVITVFNFIIGIIISIYLLASKETFAGQAKKAVYAFCEKSTANRFIKDMHFVHRTFINFISGKIFDSIIIGLLCFIGTTLIGTPYPILISVIIGVTNIIPFFGPYLGAIPSALFILVIDPIQCFYFIIFILVLQQIDGNIIGPKILGDSTGLSSFWVIFSITIFGGMFGVFGMIIGVPVFAVIFAMSRTMINRMLKTKGLPVETGKYMRLKEINDEKEFINISDQDKENDMMHSHAMKKSHKTVEETKEEMMKTPNDESNVETKDCDVE